MRFSYLAASLLSAALLAAPAGAATNPKSKAGETPQQTTAKTRQQGWRAQCSSTARGAKPDCAVNQRIVLAKTGQLVAGITIKVPSKTRKPVLMLQAPLGLYLPPGMTIAFGGKKAETIALQTCDNKGCYAGQPLSGELLKKFRRGDKMTITFQNMGRQEIKVNVSLKGFAEEYDKVK